MRKFLIVVSLLFIGFVSHAQYFKGFFAPKPNPLFQKSQSFKLSADSSTLTENFFRPVVNVTAATSAGVSLAAGAGVAFQHDKFDVASGQWVVQYGLGGVAWLGTNGSKITGTVGGIVQVPGTNGLIGIGGGYDLTQKVPVLLTGVSFNF